MNKTDLINAVTADTDPNISKQDCTYVINATLSAITETLAIGEDVGITDFGSFKVVNAEARTGRNPKTGETINIPAKKKVTFKPGKHLKELIQG